MTTASPPYAENFHPPSAPPTSGNQNSQTIGVILVVLIFLFVFSFILCCLPYLRTIPTFAPSASTNSSRRRRFFFAPEDPLSLCNMGLDARDVEALPIFEHKAQSFKDALDCAVCLSEFEENEKAGFLPNCKHRFHVDCIDMWFHSHSTCPICRTGVQQWLGNNNTDEISVNVELISSANREFLISPGLALGETSSHEARNRSGLTISSMPEATTDIPRRSERF